MRRALRRLLTALVFLLPLGLLLTAGILMVRRYFRTAEKDLGPVLAQEATNALGHEVKVGKVTLKGGKAYVDNVQIAEGRKLADKGPILTAKQVIADFDLRQILLSGKLPQPLFGNVEVIEPVARLVRDASGRWNFADLIKPQKKTNQPSAVGKVTIRNGVVSYTDYSVPHNPKRPATRLHARLVSVDGTVLFNRDRSVDWDVTARGTQGQVQFQSARVLGGYDPNVPRTYVRANVDRASLPLANRFLPPDTNVAAGLASGRVTLVFQPGIPGTPAFDYLVNASLAGGRMVSTRLAEPVHDVAGQVTVAKDLATVRLDAGCAGSLLHAEGTVLDFAHPALNGWATGGNLQLGRLMAALDLGRQYPAFRPLSQVAATADVRASVRGPLNALHVQASGPATVRGVLPGGAALPETGRLEVAFSGSLSAPRVGLSGVLPVVRFRDYTARDVRVSALYTPARAAVDLSGKFGGGTVVARADVTPNGKRTAYRVVARVRGVQAGALPLPASLAKHAVRGLVSADIAAAGRTDQRTPTGTASLTATGLRYDQWTLRSAAARVRAAAGVLTVERAVVRDPKGLAVASGTVDLNRRALNLRLSADHVDIAALPVKLARPAAAGGTGKAAPIEGIVYLRDGRVTGTLSDPRLNGRLYAYDVRTDKYGVDYATADVTASRSALLVNEATVYRLPAVASVSGLVRAPLTKHATVDLTGELRDLPLHDLLALAGSDLDVTGTAGATFSVTGPLAKPEVSAPRVTIANGRYAEYLLGPVAAAVTFQPGVRGGLWQVRDLSATVLAPEAAGVGSDTARAASVTGSATLDGSRRFTVDARATNLDLDLADRFAWPYADMAGTAAVAAEGVTGVLKDGKVEQLAGRFTASTQGMTVNGVSLGDLHGENAGQPATFALSGDVITSNDAVIGSRASGAYLTAGTSGAPAFRYDVKAGTLAVNGALSGIGFEQLRQVAAASPYMHLHPENLANDYLKPGKNPLEGALAATFNVAGPMDDLRTDATWHSQNARFADQAVQVFEGRAVVDKRHLAISGPGGRSVALLQADETVVSASGALDFANAATGAPGTVDGSVSINSLPISILDRWFPGRPIMRDLSGDAENIEVLAQGELAAPHLTVSALLQNVAWVETVPIAGTPAASQPAQAAATPAPTAPLGAQVGNATPAPPTPTLVVRHDLSGAPVSVPTTGRELHIERIDVSKATVNDPASPNTIRADDVHVTVLEPEAAPPPPNAAKTAAKPGAPPPKPAQPPTKTELAQAPPVAPGDARSHLIYLSGQVEFDWHNMKVLQDPMVDLQVRIEKQGLGLLTALSPNVPLEVGADAFARTGVVGTIAANLHYHGRLANNENDVGPQIEGSAQVNASRIHFRDATTEVRNLAADLQFSGDTLHVNQFTAQTAIVNPRTMATVTPPDPARTLTITGDLPLNRRRGAGGGGAGATAGQPAGPSLHVALNKLRVAEAPLPGLRSGALVSDGMTADIAVTGSLLRPILTGDVNIAQTAFRMPDTFFPLGGPGAAAIVPTFHLRFAAGDRVQVSASVVSATVHTEPGAPVTLDGSFTSRANPMRLAGTLVVDRGTLAFPQFRFAIQRGSTVAVRYPTYELGSLNEPSVSLDANITATTHLTATSVNGVRKRYTITADVHGPINAGAPLQLGDTTLPGIGVPGQRTLQISFTSNPPDLAMSQAAMQQRVVGLLGGQDTIQELFGHGSDIGQILRSQLTSAISNSLLPGLFERYFGGLGGFEELSIDVTELNAFTLTATRQLFGPIYVTYIRRLTGTSTSSALEGVGWEVRFSYRFPVNLLRGNLQFSYSLDSQKTNAYLLEGVFRF